MLESNTGFTNLVPVSFAIQTREKKGASKDLLSTKSGTHWGLKDTILGYQEVLIFDKHPWASQHEAVLLLPCLIVVGGFKLTPTIFYILQSPSGNLSKYLKQIRDSRQITANHIVFMCTDFLYCWWSSMEQTHCQSSCSQTITAAYHRWCGWITLNYIIHSPT